jgi:hypothetical protein
MSINHNKLITIFIDGDKNGFNTKNSIDRFKKKIKLNNDLNLDELIKEFIKNDYNLEIIEKNDELIKFNITKKEIIKEDINNARQELRNKLKNMIKSKSNRLSNMKRNVNIPEEITKEYLKLIKLNISNNNIPSPQDVFAKKEEYKMSIPLILNNPQIKKLPQSHPYIKYFKLLAKHLDITDEHLNIPPEIINNLNNIQLPDNIQSLINKSGSINNVLDNIIGNINKTNDNKKDDEDTDTEEEIICDTPQSEINKDQNKEDNNKDKDKDESNKDKEDDDIEIINSYEIS